MRKINLGCKIVSASEFKPNLPMPGLAMDELRVTVVNIVIGEFRSVV